MILHEQEQEEKGKYCLMKNKSSNYLFGFVWFILICFSLLVIETSLLVKSFLAQGANGVLDGDRTHTWSISNSPFTSPTH